MKKLIITAFLVWVSLSVFAAPVTWEFPRTRSCHEGLAFADGVTGVLVWGGGDTINLTVGRADLWDHRGGYPWTPEQNYSNIVAAVRSGDADRLLGLFRKDTPPGEPRNPYILPLGRVVITIPGATLKSGELDPYTGLGKLTLSDGRAIEIAMSKQRRAFAMKFPEDLKHAAKTVPATQAGVYQRDLQKLGFEKAEVTESADGCSGRFSWQLPADDDANLFWMIFKRSFVLTTGRGRTFEMPVVNFDHVSEDSRAYWSDFWKKSAKISVPDPLVQRVFEYGMYRFGAMTDPDGVPAGLQGPWLEDDKLVPWNGDYHFNINVQECYSPAYRGGHFENLMPLFKMILSWRERLRDNAEKFVGIKDGYVLPHSVDDRGVCIGGFWTGTIDHASTAWVAAMMFKYVKYAKDEKFLKENAYDFMKGAMNVYLAMFEEKNGKLSLPLGPSPEWAGADVKKAVGRDPSFQLAAAHRLARDLISAAEILGDKPDSRWLDVEQRLPSFTADASGLNLFVGPPFVESHRHHSHMAGLYPFDTIDIHAPENKETIKATYDTWIRRGTGWWSGWCVPWASILHTHAGNSERAVDLLHDWDRYFCNDGHGSRHNAFVSGFSVMGRGGVGEHGDAPGEEGMQMDGQCAATAAAMELLVHEVNGKVEYFRGCPADWKDVSFENIALSDGTRVSGRRVNGKVEVEKTP